MNLMFDWLRKNLGGERPAGGRGHLRSLRLRRIFDETEDLSWGLLRRFGVPRTRLEDSFQEIYLIVSERLDDIEVGKERSFIYGVAWRVARGARRAFWREILGQDVDVPVELALGAEARVDRSRLVELCDRILGTLAPELREVFLLHEFEGLTGAEISTLLGIPQGTVHSRLRRCRQLVHGQAESPHSKVSARATPVHADLR